MFDAISASPVIVWFRNDLRVHDNPALNSALASGQPVVALYIHDEESPGLRALGGASKWWLHHSLLLLADRLGQIGVPLVLRAGAAHALLMDAVSQKKATAVFWNRRYGMSERRIDESIKSDLKAIGVQVQSFNSHLLYEPWEVMTKAGTFYSVFTPFWRSAQALGHPSLPQTLPIRFKERRSDVVATVNARTVGTLEKWNFLPKNPDWAGDIRATFKPGEAAAQARLQEFIDKDLKGYATLRDRPDLNHTSRLSPHLRFGEISPRQVWHSVMAAVDSERVPARDAEKFLAELGWREFSYHLLYHVPTLPTENFQPRFNHFPWVRNASALKKWQKGMTGYPLVDAGMRELWETGTMHNRVRMVVASFLVKHLQIDWREGEEWFWDTLVDADPASNAASWQWVAGCGADAAPYFRVFNPIIQGEKFDAKGDYVRRYVPELSKLPSNAIHKPWTLNPTALADAGVILGKNYPHPMVDHAKAREAALAAFARISGSKDSSAGGFSENEPVTYQMACRDVVSDEGSGQAE